MRGKPVASRRRFLSTSTAAGSLGLLAALDVHARAADAPAAKKEEEISPVEDLMREHGLLNRILLIYEESGRRLRRSQDIDLKTLGAAAKIVQRFVEDYHEKLEEDFVFPRFEKAGKLPDLVKTLRDQHQAGRRLTAKTQQAAAAAGPLGNADRQQLASVLRLFVRMYRPHEAREDTVLFPAFRNLVPEKEYEALGDQFEKKEDQLFGEGGFEKMVDQVAALEKTLGLYDLEQFTPNP
jgi:hemerythrin-like domain-containing protein